MILSLAWNAFTTETDESYRRKPTTEVCDLKCLRYIGQRRRFVLQQSWFCPTFGLIWIWFSGPYAVLNVCGTFIVSFITRVPLWSKENLFVNDTFLLHISFLLLFFGQNYFWPNRTFKFVALISRVFYIILGGIKKNRKRSFLFDLRSWYHSNIGSFLPQVKSLYIRWINSDTLLEISDIRASY